MCTLKFKRRDIRNSTKQFLSGPRLHAQYCSYTELVRPASWMFRRHIVNLMSPAFNCSAFRDPSARCMQLPRARPRRGGGRAGVLPGQARARHPARVVCHVPAAGAGARRAGAAHGGAAARAGRAAGVCMAVCLNGAFSDASDAPGKCLVAAECSRRQCVQAAVALAALSLRLVVDLPVDAGTRCDGGLRPCVGVWPAATCCTTPPICFVRGQIIPRACPQP